MKLYAFLLLLASLSTPGIAQSDSVKAYLQRLKKIELIMRFQDLRTIHDGKLISFLSDRDSVVRERAVRAFGSIQDTSVIHHLVQALFDRSVTVQLSAAYAIGQTAGLMSEASRSRLEHDLIWTRLERTQAIDRMIEEIGKFGTADGLRDLLIRFGRQYPPRHAIPLMMSIARFAIRGITSDEATVHLLRFVKPADEAPWQAVYALQRIGDHQQIRYEFEHIVRLSRHRDPRARMHAAILLGKLRDEKTSLEPLQKLVEEDEDWRVRVSALRALGHFSLEGKDEVVRTFYRALSHENVHIALTAVSTFGTTKVEERQSTEHVSLIFQLLRRMARNSGGHYVWQLQGEAAIALAKLSGASALDFVLPTTWPQPKLQAQLLTAMAQTGSRDAADVLFEKVSDSDPLVSRTALDGLQLLVHKQPDDTLLLQRTYEVSLAGLSRNDAAVITTSAGILGDILFQRPASVEPLLQALSRLRVPDDVEAIQAVVKTLGKLKDERAVKMLIQYLEKHDRSIALASASSLKAITGVDYSARLPRSFEPLFTDLDFTLLRDLPDTVEARLETIRGDVHLQLYKNVAPFTVLSFVKLARRGFYRGLTFHRVVPNFVVQGGDPRGDGWGGPGYSIRSEFSAISFDEGSVGIASAGKDTEGSQFFITHSPQPHLDGRYTLFGRVKAGMEYVDRIQVDDRIFDVKILQ